MVRKNYKSDFDAVLHLRACVPGEAEAVELGWPDYDWEARFWTTSRANAYVASCRGGVCTNCFDDGGAIHVVFKNHRLGRGVLQVEFRAELPNGIYPDGIQGEVTPQALGVELVEGRGDCGVVADLEVTLPVVGVGHGAAAKGSGVPASLGGLVKRRCIMLTAEPGNVYRNKDGMIKISRPRDRVSSTIPGWKSRYDLKRVYVRYRDELVPLAECELECKVIGMKTGELGWHSVAPEYEIDGDGVLTVVWPEIKLTHARVVLQVCHGVSQSAGHVTVQWTADGKRVFTFLENYVEVEAVPKFDVYERYVWIVGGRVLCWRRGVQVQMWAWSKETGWKWRNIMNGHSIGGRKMWAIRVRRKSRRTLARSEWTVLRCGKHGDNKWSISM